MGGTGERKGEEKDGKQWTHSKSIRSNVIIIVDNIVHDLNLNYKSECK